MQVLINVVGQFEFLPGDDILSSAAAANCRKTSLFTSLCKNVLFLFGGFNSELFDDVNILIFLFWRKAFRFTAFLIFPVKIRVDSGTYASRCICSTNNTLWPVDENYTIPEIRSWYSYQFANVWITSSPNLSFGTHYGVGGLTLWSQWSFCPCKRCAPTQ